MAWINKVMSINGGAFHWYLILFAMTYNLRPLDLTLLEEGIKEKIYYLKAFSWLIWFKNMMSELEDIR